MAAVEQVKLHRLGRASLAHGHRRLHGSSLLGLLHGIQVAGVCALLRNRISLLLDERSLLGLRGLELLLATQAVLDDLQLICHLRVGRCNGRWASELERTLTWVGCHDRRWRRQSGQGRLRLHPCSQFLGGDRATEDVEHTLGAGGRTGRHVALLTQQNILAGDIRSTRPHASHDDWATHWSERLGRRGESQRSGRGRATQLERSAGGCTRWGDRREVWSHRCAGASRRASAGWLGARCDDQVTARSDRGGLGRVQQVLRLAAAQVGNTTQWATDTKASGERVDQAVDTLGRGEVLAGDTQQQSFLSRLCGTFERTAHTETYRTTLEQFTSLLGASSPGRQRSAA